VARRRRSASAAARAAALIERSCVVPSRGGRVEPPSRSRALRPRGHVRRVRGSRSTCAGTAPWDQLTSEGVEWGGRRDVDEPQALHTMGGEMSMSPKREERCR
jgi:hypothetical protein